MTSERVELAVWMVKTFAYHNYQWRRGDFEKKIDLFLENHLALWGACDAAL